MKMRISDATGTKKDLRIDSMVKPLSAAELAVLAAGPPRAGARNGRFLQMEEGEQPLRSACGSTEESGCCSRAAAASPIRAAREEAALYVSKEWLHVEHPRIEEVEAGTPVMTADERRVRRRLSARITTPGGSELVEAGIHMERPSSRASFTSSTVEVIG